MKVLYFMDPFVDFDDKFDDRSFVAKYDLNAVSLARNMRENKDLSVYYAAISTILDKRGIREELQKAGIKVYSFDKAAIKGLLDHNNTSDIAVQTNKVSQDCSENIKRYLRWQFKGLQPDVVVYWENACEYIKEIFPEAIFLEGSHTGFWFIEGNADILYTVYRGKDKLTKFNKEDIEKLQLTKEEISEIEQFRSFFKAHLAPETQLTRELLDPSSRFKHFVLYPGNFPSSKFKKFSGFSNNQNVLSLLLDTLPEDCAILYTPHRLDKLSSTPSKLLNDRIIDLSKFSKIDKNLTLKALSISDAVINVYSNIYMPAMTLGTPVFSIGDSYNADFALGNLTDLRLWLKSDRAIPSEYRDFEQKVLFYVLTRKINSSFTATIRGSLLYLCEVLRRINDPESGFDCLPALATVRGYLNQFRQNLLFKNPFVDSYKPTQLDVLLSHMINPKIKAFGFDVFDTLLCRPFLRPIDLFDLMEKDAEDIIGKKSINFSRTRIAAEYLARHGKVEVKLDEIYDVLEKQLSLTKIQRISLQDLEVTLEQRFLKARETALNLFRLAKQEGKKVFIASDMYLSTQTVAGFLENNGYCLDGVEVYVSCDRGAVKHDGSLFRYLAREIGVNPTETVFIGDNVRSDVAMPSEMGFIGTHFPKAIDVFSENPLFDGNVMKFLKDSTFGFHWGYLANRLFDNPFIRFNKKEVVNNSPALLGYLIFGPLVLSLTEWLSEKCKKENYDSILFASRDSRVIIDIYNYWREKLEPKLPNGQYIYISRAATLPVYCDREHILTLLSLYASRLSTADYLKKIFDIDVNKRPIKRKLNQYKIDLEQDNRVNTHKLPAFLLDYFKDDSELQEKIECIRDYFSPMIENKNVACFDLGTRGTSRDILEDVFETKIDLFLFRATKYKYKNNLQAYMQTTINPYRHGIHAVLPQFYELLLSDPLVKSCQGYERVDGKVYPIVECSDFTESSLLVIEAQRYIRDFCFEFIDLFKNYSDCINSQCRTSYIYPLSYLCANTTDKTLMFRFEGDDPFFTKENFAIIPGEKKAEPSASSSRPNGPKVAQTVNKVSGLQAKLARSPEEYFRDSRIPALRAVYKIRNVPLLGRMSMSIATKIAKSVVFTKSQN